MKRILFSLGTLIVVAAVVVGGTLAFYNDTETSTGNIFTAGSIDLRVDHTKQTYNGIDCATCSVTLVSDTTDVVTERRTGGSTGNFDDGVLDGAFVPHNAVVIVPHPAWATIPGANWIWEQNPVTFDDTLNNAVYTFEKTFTWNGGPVEDVSLAFSLASDNGYRIYLNGNLVDSDGGEFNYSSVTVIPEGSIKPFLVLGSNTLKIQVQNHTYPGGPSVNPAGLIYKLTIDGNCEDNYFQQQCHLWNDKDLDETDQFFNFDDVKPGDWGTNVISLHVFDNDAYACLIIGDKDDQEHLLLDTEEDAGDAPNQGNDLGFGELSNYIEVFTWLDADNDGLYDGGEAVIGGPTLMSDAHSLANLDSETDLWLTATTTDYIGLAWCAGTLSAIADQPFDCDGSGNQNDAQSDSFEASLTAYAEQTRNNGQFLCENALLPPEE